MPPEYIVAIIVVAIVGLTITQVVKAIAATRQRHGVDASELAQLKQHVEQIAAAVEESQTQIAELHERADFAERLLTQARDRAALEAQHKRE